MIPLDILTIYSPAITLNLINIFPKYIHQNFKLRNYFPKRPSGALLHTLSKLYDVPVGFVTPPPFWGWVLLILRSPKGGCCSISVDLSCSCKFTLIPFAMWSRWCGSPRGVWLKCYYSCIIACFSDVGLPSLFFTALSNISCFYQVECTISNISTC